jgi:hypothetical protein
MLGVAAGPQVGADDRQAVRRLRDRYLGVLQQNCPPRAHSNRLRAIAPRPAARDGAG